MLFNFLESSVVPALLCDRKMIRHSGHSIIDYTTHLFHKIIHDTAVGRIPDK